MLAVISITHVQTMSFIRLFPHNLSSTGMNVEKSAGLIHYLGVLFVIAFKTPPFNF